MQGTKKSVGIYTLGCKVNQYESEAIAEELVRRGFEVISQDVPCDAYVINTCTVTAESDRKARQFIRRAIKKNPAAFVAVTGCLAQTCADSLATISSIDVIVGNTEKLRVADAIEALFVKGEKNSSPEIFVSDINRAEFEPMSITRFDRTRAYVKIEDGCENKCAYCIIPTARGKVRSKRPADVLDEVRSLTARGCPEVVLTGIETASYGKDLGCSSLRELLTQVDTIDGIGRVRLGSLDPSLIKRPFAEAISALPSVAPHFHLSLQSGSSRVLALMRRKYNAEQARESISLLREYMPRAQFTTDVIVGFPEETEEDFLQTCEFVREARFLNVHVFPYSKRAGTPAASMKSQIPEEIKKDRLHRLEALVDDVRLGVISDAIASEPCREVLFETFKDGYAYGHTAEFIEVAVRSDSSLHGEFFTVHLTQTDGRVCYGEITGKSPRTR